MNLPVRRWVVAGLLALAVGVPAAWFAAARAETPTAAPLSLLPGEYLWLPALSPRGPVLVLVSLPEQRAYVYRNGVRIGVATVSTGMPGFETPTGVFTILQKKREHFSNLYDDAPMPFMQRLTWDGVAMHAGRIPGHPASHGCVRLPYEFSRELFGVTERGMTVVITDQAGRAPLLADPGLFPSPPPADPPATTLGTPLAGLRLATPAYADYDWSPERAPAGALTVVLSTRDGRIVVLREGIRIGQGPVAIQGPAPSGTRAFLMLEGVDAGAPPVLPGKPRRRWLQVMGEAQDPAALAGSFAVAPEFAALVYEAMTPGTSLVLTDEPLAAATALTVLEAEGTPAAPPIQADQGPEG